MHELHLPTSWQWPTCPRRWAAPDLDDNGDDELEEGPPTGDPGSRVPGTTDDAVVSAELRRRLVHAFAAWDRRPTNWWTVRTYEDTAAEAAAVMGMGTTRLRELLGQARKAGATCAQAVRIVCG